MSELKPCPFCGGKAAIEYGENNFFSNRTDYLYIRCFNCRGDWMLFNNWQSRPIEDALRAENERLKKALEEIADGDRRDTFDCPEAEYYFNVAYKAINEGE